jgi:predicted nucleic acid-binding protein
MCYLIHIALHQIRCKDRDDQKFLELSARCSADVLVSKDKALLKLRGRTKLAFQIVGPALASRLITDSNDYIGKTVVA